MKALLKCGVKLAFTISASVQNCRTRKLAVGTLMGLMATLSTVGSAQADMIYLQFDHTDAQARYAARQLSSALQRESHTILPEAAQSHFRITLEHSPDTLKTEAYDVTPQAGSLTIAGGDGRGLIYGAQSVVEQLENGATPETLQADRDEPATAFRAIKFNLPWDSYRSSSALDLHVETARDVRYWEAFLDMMAKNRFNALTLWNLHPFPYMIRAKNFPEASRFTDAELAQWQKLYEAIFCMAKERGIDTYLVNWNILVSPEFAKIHNLETTNYYPFYKGDANTTDLVKRYTRESVTQVLQEYPDLTGLGFTFGEQMGGITPKQRQDWIEETMIAGMKDAGRPVKMIFRAPLSSDLGQEGSTSKATEELARESIEKLEGIETPVWVELKFNWSHGHSTPQLVKVHGGALKDTFFNPTPQNYRIVWTIRNEDFYTLRWGAPDFIREHLKENGHQDYVGGYIIGSENYIPARDYATKLIDEVDWQYGFERQWLFYREWGRLLYNPATPDRVFEADFTRRYGEQAKPLVEAFSLASQTQLLFTTSIDFGWDFTVYAEGMMVLNPDGIHLEPMSVDRLIEQKPLLDHWLTVADLVAREAANKEISAETMTPLKLADQLERNSTQALKLVEGINPATNAALLYEVSDVRIWSSLGLYYAEKLRGAVALQRYRTAGDEANKQAAIAHLEKSLAYWDQVVAMTTPLYKSMPLTPYNGPNNARNEDNRFHWAFLRPAVARDVEVAKNAVAGSH